MNLINQYSYLLIGTGTLAASLFFFRSFLRVRWHTIAAIHALIMGLFITGFVVLRPGLVGINDADRALATIGNGRPTFVEFFSNYCASCLSMNPIINQIENDIEDEFNVLRVDIHSSVGRTVRQELGFSFTPEFILFDLDGNEVWRAHFPPSNTDLDKARQ